LSILPLFLYLTTSLLGIRRTRDQRVAPDKFCFNHHLTDKNLEIEARSLFSAQTYSRLVPVFGDIKLIQEFYGRNAWVNEYVLNFNYGFFNNSISERLWFLAFVVNLAELVLLSPLGIPLELIASWFQKKRIAANPATYEKGGRVVFNDKVLEFHPRSFEKTVMERYLAGLGKFGIAPVAPETNSGLS